MVSRAPVWPDYPLKLGDDRRRNLLVLDQSCGDGELLAAFAGVVGPAALSRVQLIGVDEDPAYVERAQERLRDLGARSVRVIKTISGCAGLPNYLSQHRKQLEARRYVIEAGRNWYEIWVPQDPSAWTLPKLVFPDISPKASFYYDDDGYLVDGDGYWITLRQGITDDVLLLVLGFANSELMAKYHDLAFNNRLYSGRRRFLTQYVECYPVPDPTSPSSRRIIETVRQLITVARTSRFTGDMESLLERRVEAAFGFSA